MFGAPRGASKGAAANDVVKSSGPAQVVGSSSGALRQNGGCNVQVPAMPRSCGQATRRPRTRVRMRAHKRGIKPPLEAAERVLECSSTGAVHKTTVPPPPSMLAGGSTQAPLAAHQCAGPRRLDELGACTSSRAAPCCAPTLQRPSGARKGRACVACALEGAAVRQRRVRARLPTAANDGLARAAAAGRGCNKGNLRRRAPGVQACEGANG